MELGAEYGGAGDPNPTVDCASGRRRQRERNLGVWSGDIMLDLGVTMVFGDHQKFIEAMAGFDIHFRMAGISGTFFVRHFCLERRTEF